MAVPVPAPISGAKARIVIADDEPSLRKILGSLLRRDGYEVAEARDGEEALRALSPGVSCLITDLRMPGMDGMALFRRAIAELPALKVIIFTAYGRITESVEAVKLGAFDYIEKGADQEYILQVVRKAVRSFELDQASPAGGMYQGAPPGLGRFGLIGNSAPLAQVFAVIEKVADTPSTILITGESGTGKELVARALHEHSRRRGEPFIKINCAAIPETLMEAELFGYEKGAFTGAVSSKPGRFELADHGTLFLDEIGELPLDMQVKLLRVLQECEFERVGGIKTIKVDVRVIAATNRALMREVAQGKFREELFYRLNVVPIALPSLRDRLRDIPLLCQHFLSKFNERLNKSISALSPEALAVLLAYPFPGNIRELENVMERTILLSEGPIIQAADLPQEILTYSAAAEAPRGEARAEAPRAERPEAREATTPKASLKEIVRQETERVERELIQRALEQTSGNVTQAARQLKISRKSLQNKMKDFGLRDKE